MPRKPTPQLDADWLAEECQRCADDYDRFNTVVLGRGRYWSRQVEVCHSVRDYRTTAVVTGNGVGKSYLGAGIILAFAASHPDCRVVATAPTLGQLSNVLWREVEKAVGSADRDGLPLGGRLRALSLDFGEGWQVEGFGSGSVESKSGRHSGDLLAVIDEASGVPAGVLEAINSLNPSRYLYLGNPIRPEGQFYEVCELSGDNPTTNVIRIPSLESPDIDLDRSPRGMADRGWLDDSRHRYGEESLWWLSHVLAQFPNQIEAALLPIPWLNAAADASHKPAGDVWLGVDLGEGQGGGDPTELVCRDLNGVVGWESSSSWDLEIAAERTRVMAEAHSVAPERIVYDQAGLGADFDNRLRAVGLRGCKGYKGSRDGGDRFLNLRAAAAWQLRRRLDPARQVRGPSPPGGRPVWVPQHPFAIPKHIVDRYRAELTGVRYLQTPAGEIALEPKDQFVKRLKKSPNFLDALAMTFAYPFA